MKNVKELLKSWKYAYEAGNKLVGTHYEVLSLEQLKSLEGAIQSLEEAITKDGNTIGKWEVVGEQTKHNLKF